MANNHLFLKSGFVRAPLENGLGRHICQLQRVVIKFCKHNGSSRGVRDFVENDLINLAREQPGVAVYLKPRRHRSPVIVGEYLNGDRQWFSLHNKDRAEVNGWLANLLGAQGSSGLRYRKLGSTLHPSVQGPWRPRHSLTDGLQLDRIAPSPAGDKLIAMAKEQGILPKE